MNDSLTMLLEKAKNDKQLKDRIFATRSERNPVNALCVLATAEGFPLCRLDFHVGLARALCLLLPLSLLAVLTFISL